MLKRFILMILLAFGEVTFANSAFSQIPRFRLEDERLKLEVQSEIVPLFAGVRVTSFAADNKLLVFLDSSSTLYGVDLSEGLTDATELSAYKIFRIETQKPFKVGLITPTPEWKPSQCEFGLEGKVLAVVEGDIAFYTDDNGRRSLKGILNRKETVKRFRKQTPTLRSLWPSGGSILH